MSDLINSITQNADGSFDLNFTFDAGNGVTANTVISLPPPISSVDANDVIIPAVAYTMETAKAAAMPIAIVKKAAWLNSIAAASVVGPVTL